MYYSNSVRIISRQQSMRRTRRIGSEKHPYIRYIDMVTEGSIEVTQHSTMQRGLSVVSYVLDELKRGISVRNLL